MTCFSSMSDEKPASIGNFWIRICYDIAHQSLLHLMFDLLSFSKVAWGAHTWLSRSCGYLSSSFAFGDSVSLSVLPYPCDKTGSDRLRHNALKSIVDCWKSSLFDLTQFFSFPRLFLQCLCLYFVIQQYFSPPPPPPAFQLVLLIVNWRMKFGAFKGIYYHELNCLNAFCAEWLIYFLLFQSTYVCTMDAVEVDPLVPQLTKDLRDIAEICSASLSPFKLR